jgi:hypothetical protein
MLDATEINFAIVPSNHFFAGQGVSTGSLITAFQLTVRTGGHK